MDKRVFIKFFKSMSWNQSPVSDFGDLSYLMLANYTATLQALIARSEPWFWGTTDTNLAPPGHVSFDP